MHDKWTQQIIPKEMFVQNPKYWKINTKKAPFSCGKNCSKKIFTLFFIFISTIIKLRNSISEFSVSWIITTKIWSIFFFLLSYFINISVTLKVNFPDIFSLWWWKLRKNKNTVQTKLKKCLTKVAFFFGVVVTSWTFFFMFCWNKYMIFFWCWRSVWEKGTWSFFFIFCIYGKIIASW